MYVGDISASSHAVKQGVSDAYYEDTVNAGDTKSGTGHCIIWSEVVERNCL